MIPKNQIFAAPMAGISDKPFRTMVRMFAPDLPMVTEMISCHSLTMQHKNCLRNFDNYADEGNIGAQIFGAAPRLMADAAMMLQDAGAAWTDINMGCPVPKVATRAGAGAFLMRNHKLAGEIINAVVRAVQIPVSIKTRLGWDDSHKDWQNLIHIAADNGAKFAVLHGRTRAAGYVGSATHPEIKDMPIPIIANGDIKSSLDVQNMLHLGYDGAMMGRAMLGRPWIFGRVLGIANVPQDMVTVVTRHLELMIEYYGEKTAVSMFRKHLAWYSAGMPNSADFRTKINQLTDVSAIKQEILQFWGCVANI